MTPPQNTTHPVPIGELLEQLRAEGFAVALAQYGRVFTVVESLFPQGITPQTSAEDWKTLCELLGPIVCRTFAEQERFGAVFNAVMAGQVAKSVDPELVDDESNQDDESVAFSSLKKRFWPIEALIIGGLAIALVILMINKETEMPKPTLDCAVDFSLSVHGNTVTFVNRSPGVANGQMYEWNFGDGTSPLSTSQTTVRHQFSRTTGSGVKSQVTLKAVGCPDMPNSTTEQATPSTTYNPTPLPFLRLPETSRYVLANWVPLLLMGLSGLLGGGWWLVRRRRQHQRAAQRPVGGPFFLSFPPQDDAIQPSPSLLNWAQQLQQREESERHVLAILPTIRQTVRNGGMPSVQYEAIKRRPRYLILIDDRSAYDQQAKLYAYVMGVLITRSVEMDVFFLHSDPRYLWNENYPKGLSIADLFRLYGAHYLVLVTEGARLLDYDTGEVADWAVDALSGWTSRALLTPVYPANWHYLEAALSRFFILLPATPDGQIMLRDYLGQPDNAPSFEELLRQFKVLPGTPNRGIFAPNTTQMTVADVRTFLNSTIQGIDQSSSVREWLFTWACATAVFPTPDWAMTLAIGRTLETEFNVEGLVTSTNILKLTALPWLRQDTIPEPLRTNLLAQLSPKVNRVARQTVVDMLNDLKLSPGSVAYEEQQIRLWEQEFHLNNSGLGELTAYQKNPDLIKDPLIQQQLVRQERIEISYQPAALLVLILLPLLLYFTPPQTQVASVLVPFFRTDSSTMDSATYYNNRAVALLKTGTANNVDPYGRGILDLVRSVEFRLTFEAMHNLNTARYNLAVLERSQRLANGYAIVDINETVRQLLSPFKEVPQLMAPLKLFDKNWVPDSVVTRRYLTMLANRRSNDDLFYFANIENQGSINSNQNEGLAINNPINRPIFNQLADKAKTLFQLPGTREFDKDSADKKLEISRLLGSFKTTSAQRDSLISLEAARIVLYFGGPQRSVSMPLDPMEVPTKAMVPETMPINAQTNDSRIGIPVNTTPQANRINLRIKPKATAKQPTPSRVKNRIQAYPVSADSLPVQQQPVSTSIDNLNTEPVKAENLPEKRLDVPATVGSDNPPSNQQAQQQQQVQQQQVQQQPPTVDESTLQQVYEQETKCPTNNSYSISVPKGDKRSIQSGVLIQLSDSPNLYELVFYCETTSQTIYSKRGFSHVKMEKDTKGNGIRLVFYQNRQRVYKK